MSVAVVQCGIMEFREAYLLQKSIRDKVTEGKVSETILLMEHLPVITIGKSGNTENVLVPGKELAGNGISLFFTDRGGDVTFHGPGQLVIYPIIDLRQRGKDAHKYVSGLEETAIRTLGDYSITGTRDDSHAGIWVGNNEIAAIGISLSKWVTMHGMALNVNNDLHPFSLINPCGFADRGAVSMSQILSRELPVIDVTEKFLKHFEDVFETCLEWQSSGTSTGGTYE